MSPRLAMHVSNTLRVRRSWIGTTGSSAHRDSITTKLAKKIRDSGIGQRMMVCDAKLDRTRTTEMVYLVSRPMSMDAIKLTNVRAPA